MERVVAPVYEYAPFPGTKSIRLLRLGNRLDSNASLTGSLISRHLDDSEPEYTTLSYSWGRSSDGDASLSRFILLDGCTLAITENLYDYLTLLSEPNKANPPLLWIDAICIDQKNVMERGNQVSIMASVYTHASNLVIWLGHGASEEEDREALEALSIWDGETLCERTAPQHTLLQTIAPVLTGCPLSESEAGEMVAACKMNKGGRPCMFHHSPDPYSSRLWLSLVRLAFEDSNPGHCLQRHMPTSNPTALLDEVNTDACILEAIGPEFAINLLIGAVRLFKALITLCRRRYFTRRWVIQEVSRSRRSKTVLRWGSFTTKLHYFRYRLNNLHFLLSSGLDPLCAQGWVGPDVKPTLGFYTEIYSGAADILYIRENLPSEEHDPETALRDDNENVLYCVQTFQTTACADDRDLVYALLSIAGTRRSLPIDYCLSLNAVFVAFATKLVEQNLLAKLIHCASWQWSRHYSGSPLIRDAELPSWVPDLRKALPKYQKTATRRPVGSPVDNTDGFPGGVEGRGKTLRLRATIARLINLPPNHSSNATLLRVEEDDFIAQIDQYPAAVTDFVLRPVPSRPGYFVLAGNLDVDDQIPENLWDYCSDVRTEMIRLL